MIFRIIYMSYGAAVLALALYIWFDLVRAGRDPFAMLFAISFTWIVVVIVPLIAMRGLWLLLNK